MADTIPQNVPVTAEIGSTGLAVSGGKILEEFLPQLAGGKALKVYAEMRENDPVVGAVLFVIDMLIRQAEWRVDPADVPTGEEDAAFLESCLGDMSDSWQDTIAATLSFLPYGYSIQEIVYKLRKGDAESDPRRHSAFDDGRVGWRKFGPRPAKTVDRWILDEESDELRGVVQRVYTSTVERVIPVDRFLLFRTTSQAGNPEGRSVLRSAYRPWFFKKRMEEIEGIGAERDLAGLPIAWVPPALLTPDATANEKALAEAIKRVVRNVRRDEKEGLVFPLIYDQNGNKVYDFQLLSTGGTRQFDTTKIIGRYDSRIAMSVLADFILLGHEKVGSFALSSDKTDLFAVALGAWLGMIAGVFNRQAVPRLFRMNGWQREELPKLAHGDIETIDLEKLGKYIQALSGAGATLFPDATLENWCRGQASMPPIPEEEEEPSLETQLAELRGEVESLRQQVQEQKKPEPGPPAAVQLLSGGEAG